MADNGSKSLDDLKREVLEEELREKRAARVAREKAEEEQGKKEESKGEGKNQGFFANLFSKHKAEYKEAGTKGAGGVFKKTLSLPFTPFTFLLKWALFIGGIILGLSAAVVILILIFNFLSGGGFSIAGTQLSIIGSQASGVISSITTPIKNFVSDPVGTVAEFGTFKNPQTVEKTKPQGIEVKKFQTTRDIYREKDIVETVASVKAYALETEPAEISFLCLIADITNELLADSAGYIAQAGTVVATKGAFSGEGAKEYVSKKLYSQIKGELKISGEEESKNSITLLPKQDRNFNIICKFPAQSTGALFEGSEKTVNKKIILRANYKNFIVNSRIKAYTLEKSILERLENQDKNPFSEFKINDPLVSSDRSVRSEQIKKGPVILSLNILDPQPLKEDSTYLLSIGLKNDKLSWNGKISKLSSLKIYFPENFKPDEEDCLSPNSPFIAFEGFIALKPSFITSLNYLDEGIVTDSLKKDTEITDQKFFCSFKVENVEDETPTFKLIKAEAQFDYEFEAYTSATISRSLLTNTANS